MRNLTFKGFLQQYLKELSMCGSCGIIMLSKELERKLSLDKAKEMLNYLKEY